MTLKKMKIKQPIVVTMVVILTVVVDYLILKPRVIRFESNTENMTTYNAVELKKYDGTDLNRPILLALDGLVYDVSAGGDDYYKPGQSYHYLVGVDSSRYLHIFGEGLIKKKYRVVGRYAE